MKAKAKTKVLGQHFLTNKNKLREILDTLSLQAGDAVIEIGPGHGELTCEIVNKFLSLKVHEFKIIAIEKDYKFTQSLRGKYAGDKNIEIVEGDVLKILPELPKTYNLKPYTYKVVGNIPFYITGRLLRTLSELENKPLLIVLTVQKEVAERICAQPPKMNLLAASVQFWAEPEIVDYISKKDFRPQPKVDSAIIKLKSITISMRPHEKCYEIWAEQYYKLIKILFKQPRKTILNNLRDAKNANTSECREKLLKIGINPQDRPQNLSIEQIKKLA